MGLPEKPPMDEIRSLESENKKWVIAGIQFRGPLKPIFTTTPAEKNQEGGEESPTTPTAKEARIPRRLTCPAAPRKRKPSTRCHYNGVREFFTPPDLETVFIRRVERF
ncbi:cyclin-dependent protein kinase inhibitor SMR6-like [Actinidia eriantha]|uniref:cyclin-dependent protein kinase inhibitor SMR6-like n=1 Tax=Actinidia eriantha TaxID=165200 RepID=UPI00258F418D|nr:cyclin-dependent protein kinase inhibitor SMR6-like [Actinidia eriantha]